MIEENSQLKNSLKLADKNKRVLQEEIKKLKTSATVLAKERETLDTLAINLDKEMDDLKAFHANQYHDLEVQKNALSASLATLKLSRKEMAKSKYEAGYAMGIQDYMSSTFEAFPNLDWTVLGPDAVNSIEEIKKKKIKAASEGTTLKAPLDIAREVDRKSVV